MSFEPGRKRLAGNAFRTAGGTLLSLSAGGAVLAVSGLLGLPSMLLAFGVGYAISCTKIATKLISGFDFTAKHLLRAGVCLLGARIAWSDIEDMGMLLLVLTPALVATVLGCTVLLARGVGESTRFGLILGGATAICGASAALAIATVTDPDGKHDGETVFAVIVVTALSTVVMLAYPVIVIWTGMFDSTAAVFIGLSVHDVAQVVGAGYALSVNIGDAAVAVKMLRVILLIPVILLLSIWIRRCARVTDGCRPSLIPPWFLSGFVLLSVIRNLGWLPAWTIDTMNGAASVLLVAAIMALGVRTSFSKLVVFGPRALIIAIAATVLIGILAYGVAKITQEP